MSWAGVLFLPTAQSEKRYGRQCQLPPFNILLVSVSKNYDGYDDFLVSLSGFQRKFYETIPQFQKLIEEEGSNLIMDETLYQRTDDYDADRSMFSAPKSSYHFPKLIKSKNIRMVSSFGSGMTNGLKLHLE